MADKTIITTKVNKEGITIEKWESEKYRPNKLPVVTIRWHVSKGNKSASGYTMKEAIKDLKIKLRVK